MAGLSASRLPPVANRRVAPNVMSMTGVRLADGDVARPAVKAMRQTCVRRGDLPPEYEKQSRRNHCGRSED
jgi:hypothetical protein